jgi:outer membrane protein OmpA-like peptidoglycan-associated protein
MNAELGIKLKIKAYTDNTGSQEFNLELSELRAHEVVNYLVAQGIEAERLVALGFGNTRAKNSNDSEKGRAANRRVEFDIIVEVSPE